MNDVDKKRRRDIEKMQEEIALSHESIYKHLREIEESARVTKRLSYALMREGVVFLRESESPKKVKGEE